MNDSLRRLKEIVDRLREPGGCPWDRAQTRESLKPYLLEEAHEVAEAIDEGDPAALREELGDLLLNVFLQARLAEEEGLFTLDQVAQVISDKLVRRHPHVFGSSEASTPEEVRELWEGIKGKEKGSDPEPGALRPLPATLPALSQGERWGRMAAEVGFDWPDAAGPLHKVAEELEELRDAGRAGDVAQVEAEVGDLLFAVTSFCRHWGVDPERALKGALARFRERFRRIEGALAELESPSLAELDRLWARAKEADPASPPGTASPEP